jgi:hypothetical protein
MFSSSYVAIDNLVVHRFLNDSVDALDGTVDI